MGNLLLPLLLVALVIPMFLGRRRQQRAALDAQQFQDSLVVGERVMTTAGLYATVVSLTDDTADLEIAPGVITTWNRLVVKERVVEASDEYEDDEYQDYEEDGEYDVDLSAPDLVKHDAKDS